MTTYLVATTTPPAIVCPAWCTVPVENHLAALEGWEGRCIHHSDLTHLPRGGAVHLTASATPDGTEDPADPMTVWIEAPDSQDRTVADAKTWATALLAYLEQVTADA